MLKEKHALLEDVGGIWYKQFITKACRTCNGRLDTLELLQIRKLESRKKFVTARGEILTRMGFNLGVESTKLVDGFIANILHDT